MDFSNIAKTNNLSFYTLPLTLFLAACPHWWSIQQCMTKKINGGWKNDNPRGFVASLQFKAVSGKKLSGLEKKILRAQAGE
jgi:hypothetical protein